jgi:uncharacterized protein YdcH (DUF465 family)
MNEEARHRLFIAQSPPGRQNDSRANGGSVLLPLNPFGGCGRVEPGYDPAAGGDTPVSTPTEAVRVQLMASNPEYRRLQEEHSHYASQLDRLSSKHYLSSEEQMEEVRLKKLKLWTKDQMETLVHRAGNA